MCMPIISQQALNKMISVVVDTGSIDKEFKVSYMYSRQNLCFHTTVYLEIFMVFVDI